MASPFYAVILVEELGHIHFIVGSIGFQGFFDSPCIALGETTVDRRTEALVIGHLANEGTVEHRLDRPGFIEHLLDVVSDLLHGAVLIVEQILFQLGAEIRLGIVYHEGQHIGICQRVLFLEYENQMLSNLVLGIQLDSHVITILIGKGDLMRRLSDAHRLELFVHIVDAAGKVQHESAAVLVLYDCVDLHAHIPPMFIPSSSDSSSSRNSSRDLSLSKYTKPPFTN